MQATRRWTGTIGARTMLLAALAAALLACRGPQPAPAAASVSGTWKANYHVVGSSLVLALQQAGTKVTGDGSFAMEAGRTGKLTVQGTAGDSAVTLELRFDYGQTARFAGKLVGPAAMTGTITYAGFAPQPLELDRQP